jgi:hypothetical protein
VEHGGRHPQDHRCGHRRRRSPPGRPRLAHALATRVLPRISFRSRDPLLALFIAIAAIRVSRQELTGAMPAPNEAAPQPATVQEQEDRAAIAAAVRPCRFC